MNISKLYRAWKWRQKKAWALDLIRRASIGKMLANSEPKVYTRSLTPYYLSHLIVSGRQIRKEYAALSALKNAIQ